MRRNLSVIKIEEPGMLWQYKYKKMISYNLFSLIPFYVDWIILPNIINTFRARLAENMFTFIV